MLSFDSEGSIERPTSDQYCKNVFLCFSFLFISSFFFFYFVIIFNHTSH